MTGLLSSFFYVVNTLLILPAHPVAAATYKKEGKRDYDGVVYSVAVALVLIILLAFLRGFFRLKRDKKRQVNLFFHFEVNKCRVTDFITDQYSVYYHIDTCK